MKNQIFLNAKCKTLENKLLKKTDFISMIETSDPVLALKILKTHKKGISEITSPYDFEILIEEENQKLYQVIREMEDEKGIVEYFLSKIDFFNAEVLLKSYLTGNKKLVTMLRKGGLVDIQTLNRAIEEKNYDNLPENLKKVFTSFTEEDLISGRRISTAFKRELYQSYNLSNEILKEINQRIIDLTNIQSSARVENIEEFEFTKIKGGKIADNKLFEYIINCDLDGVKKDFSDCYLVDKVFKVIQDKKNASPLYEIERDIDNAPLEILDKYRYIEDGLLPTIKYIYRAEIQQKNIRIVMTGLINKLSADDIKWRLRWNYER